MMSSFKHLWFRPLTGLVLVLAGWQVLACSGLVRSFFLPPVTSVVRALAERLSSGELLIAIGTTIWRFALAMGLGTAFGVPVGIAFGRVRALYDTFIFWIEFLRALPVTALFPLFIAFFGTGTLPLLLAASLSSLLIMFVNTVEAVGNIPIELERLAKLVRLPLYRKWLGVHVPSMLPQLSQGIRNNISVTFIVVIVSEMLMGLSTGLGYSIYDSSLSFRLDVTYAFVLTTGFLGWVLNSTYLAVAHRAIHWRGR
ncbi:MAG: ABC transporter permease subunit [bacterium]|nr:ABC transporter permease subunit [bacterium]